LRKIFLSNIPNLEGVKFNPRWKICAHWEPIFTLCPLGTKSGQLVVQWARSCYTTSVPLAPKFQPSGWEVVSSIGRHRERPKLNLLCNFFERTFHLSVNKEGSKSSLLQKNLFWEVLSPIPNFRGVKVNPDRKIFFGRFGWKDLSSIRK
jgi:hypothetical protein